MIVSIKTGGGSYDVVLQQGCAGQAGHYLELRRRVLIVTDDGVPAAYAAAVAACCAAPHICTVPQGEGSKSIAVWQQLLETMQRAGFDRGDCVVAVGGGMVGDLAGFAASAYMRGINFYNIPTTVLAQVDASVGGKTALNLGGIKNGVGAFYPPKAVLADPTLLATLPPRQVANGLAEAVKMALTSDASLFALFETEDASEHLPEIVYRSVCIKKAVVEADEKEAGQRKILNFGHTIGHAIESVQGENGLYHGECVALGMLPMCSESVRARLLPVLWRLGLPTSCRFDAAAVYGALLHDKKASDGGITVAETQAVGSCRLRTVTPEELAERLRYYD